MSFTVSVTVTNKRDKLIPIWNKVWLSLDGDKSDLINLQAQLGLVKADVNKDMNQKGMALKDVDIKLEFVERQ
jgi:hypothetical protein